MGIHLPKWSNLSFYSKLAIFLVTCPAIIVSALESILAAFTMPAVQGDDLQEGSDLNSIPTYLILFISAQLFQVFFLLDGLFHKNTIQIFSQVAFNLCTVAYGFFQIDQLNDALAGLVNQATIRTARGILWAIPIVALVFTLINGFVAFKLYCEFGWRVYKKIGADPEMKKIYRVYQVLIMILKLDFYFGCLFSIQYLALVLEENDPEFAVTIAALPVVLLMLMLAVFGVRRENKRVMWGFLTLTVALLAYFVFKIVRMHTDRPQPTQVDFGMVVRDKYQGSRAYLTFFGTVTIALIVVTFINSIMCYRNFGKGLKQHVSSGSQARSQAQANDGGGTSLHTLSGGSFKHGGASTVGVSTASRADFKDWK